ncbi:MULTISPECIES: phytanoyl-CoA dioxygenase family protein [Stappia]|uniref:phytanoyl-CoA dioxygenase family protein n=1 Tax=Stappia TaxID=152161 RepID=UPI0019977049|nr:MULTISPECIES: phytanoyl-CoA dioxygenase family protein [Stappia]MCA1299070.1 phytanoyl-CoA dioxygenase family protein [Stappia indica]GGE88704.1 protein involved in biosynthesis of mitomycin antibiotics/polyketide fumonisin [Stappia taiwanensis]
MTKDIAAHADAFRKDGYTIIRGFYDPAKQVEPVRQGARWIIEALCRKYGVDAPTATVEDALGPGYLALAAASRAWGGEVYDAVKQIPAFMSLVSDPRNSELFAALRPGAVPGLAAGGYGIRIDAPGEAKFRAPWHQEFPAQLRSPDGIVFWSPLIPVFPELGPVELAVGSHKEGIVPVWEDDGGVGKTGAYALRLDREEERLARYQHAAPLTEPGDLILMDFLTLHQSGQNRSDIPRWSMQFRYFNYADPLGEKLSWKGSFAAGQSFATVLPELVASR